MARKALLVVHQQHSDPGRVARLLVERGYEIDLRRTGCGDPLPPTMEEHDAAVIFGGPMSANDCSLLPFIRAELDWLEVPLRENKPFLGICLGAQLLARCLGARVGPHPEGRCEIGYFPVRATPAGRGLFPDEQHFYQWHGEGFEVPACAELLATGEDFPNQAFRCGRAYGLQFHPEVTRDIMARWTTKGAHRLALPGAQPAELHFAGYEAHDARVEAWLRNFLDRWLGPVEARAGASLPERAAAAPA